MTNGLAPNEIQFPLPDTSGMSGAVPHCKTRAVSTRGRCGSECTAEAPDTNGGEGGHLRRCGLARGLKERLWLCVVVMGGLAPLGCTLYCFAR